MFKRLLRMDIVPVRTGVGLLLLRVIAFGSMFLKHGTEKLFTFGKMAAHFPDPLHIGALPSLMFAMLSDGICTLLLVVGVATRWAALVVLVNLFVAWSLVHHFAFLDKATGGHGELIVVYMAAALAMLFCGAGPLSLDALMAGERTATVEEESRVPVS